MNATEHVRSGKGPYLTETGRGGWPIISRAIREAISMRTKSVSGQRKIPSNLGREMLLARGIATASDLEQIDAETEQLVQDALNKAIALPNADIDNLYSNLYASIRC